MEKCIVVIFFASKLSAMSYNRKWDWVDALPDDKILDWFKLKETADDIFEVHLKWKISAI